MQETKRLLNRHLKRNADRALQAGVDAENESHDTPEYKASAETMQP